MEKGDIFYFVDMSLGKIIKLKVKEKFMVASGKDGVKFVNFNYRTSEGWIYINPTPENYCKPFSRFYGTNKNYLVFTKVEDAQKALINFVLPKTLESKQLLAEVITKEYHELIQKIEEIENKITSNTEKFDKKCNALRNKFV